MESDEMKRLPSTHKVVKVGRENCGFLGVRAYSSRITSWWSSPKAREPGNGKPPGKLDGRVFWHGCLQICKFRVLLKWLQRCNMQTLFAFYFQPRQWLLQRKNVETLEKLLRERPLYNDQGSCPTKGGQQKQPTFVSTKVGVGNATRGGENPTKKYKKIAK